MGARQFVALLRAADREQLRREFAFAYGARVAQAEIRDWRRFVATAQRGLEPEAAPESGENGGLQAAEALRAFTLMQRTRWGGPPPELTEG